MFRSFIARTRRRGEIDYYAAAWELDQHDDTHYHVTFVDGPHKGETYPEEEVAKSNYKYKI